MLPSEEANQKEEAVARESACSPKFSKDTHSSTADISDMAQR